MTIEFKYEFFNPVSAGKPHLRKEFRVKDDRGDTNFINFADIINVKTP